MHVAIVIVGFRNAQDVVACLAALAGSTYRDFEVVIWENGGAYAADLLKRDIIAAKNLSALRIEVVASPANLGFAGGVNAGIERAGAADAWWVLNPDTEPHPDALAELVERLRAGDVHAVGGILYLPDKRVQTYGGLWRPALARAVSLGNGSSLTENLSAARVEERMNYIPGASMLVDRHFLARVGPMREDFFLYAEEIDWCLRARALGMSLGLAQRALILHRQGTTTGSGGHIRGRSALSVYLDERNKLHLVRDHNPVLLPVASVAAMALILRRYLLRGAFPQTKAALRGWWAGIRAERNRPIWLESSP